MHITKNSITFAKSNDKDRNVAQLVAHYVRDVGVGRSSRLIPTEKGSQIWLPFSVGIIYQIQNDRFRDTPKPKSF